MKFAKPPRDDLLFSSKSQIKRKAKFAICSLRNSVGNIKSKGTEDQILYIVKKKKIISKKWKWSENQTKQGNMENQQKRECNQMCSASGNLFCNHRITVTPAGAFKSNAHTCCSVVWMYIETC